MYNNFVIHQLTDFITSKNGIGNKSALSLLVQKKFHLTKDRSIFYCDDFAVRFCLASSKNFGNTVLSLSALQKYDSKPFIVVVITQSTNYMMLSNSTFLKKISHSSYELRVDNIKGSFNGSDIMRVFEGILNEPNNFEFLFTSHANYSFIENLVRLVETTNNIHPQGTKFYPNDLERNNILTSINRAENFLHSSEYKLLNSDLNSRVSKVSSEIAIAAFIDNVNLRGRIIEYLITSTEKLKLTLIDALHTGSSLPEIYTADNLGDYERKFEKYSTATDIKTKILFLSSNPKGYNIDKLLSFLAKDNSVYLIYVVAINEKKQISTRLCSVFSRQLLSGTRVMKQWAGRNSRGVTQYDGNSLEEIVSNFDFEIDKKAAEEFIQKCIEL